MSDSLENVTHIDGRVFENIECVPLDVLLRYIRGKATLKNERLGVYGKGDLDPKGIRRGSVYWATVNENGNVVKVYFSIMDKREDVHPLAQKYYDFAVSNLVKSRKED